MSEVIRRFWAWYERHYTLHVGITVILFVWQLVHLYWLGADVIALRLTGVSYFEAQGFWRVLLILVDYTEIPAIVSTSLLYLFELRPASAKASSLRQGFGRQASGKRWRLVGLLVLLNSQWLHLFWITDEFVIHTFLGQAHGDTVLPIWLAWVAILIDYLELPVIFDIVRRLIRTLHRGSGLEFIRNELKK